MSLLQEAKQNFSVLSQRYAGGSFDPREISQPLTTCGSACTQAAAQPVIESHQPGANNGAEIAGKAKGHWWRGVGR